MAIAILPRGTGVPCDVIAGTFIEISQHYGFHPAKNSSRNGSTLPVLEERLVGLISRLRQEPDSVCTRRTLEHAMRGSTRRKPVPRVSNIGRVARSLEVSNDLINELTLVWASALLRYPLRGVSDPDMMLSLKDLVIWFLVRRGYELPHRDILFHDESLKWEKFEWLWMIVYRNDHWREFLNEPDGKWKPTIVR